jgi:hypothetical protein
MREISASASQLRTAHIVSHHNKRYGIDQVTPLAVMLIAALQQLGVLAIHLILLQSLPQGSMDIGQQSPTSISAVHLAPSPCNEDRVCIAAMAGAAIVGLY